MNTKYINTYLPIFKGFYGSIFEPNEDIELDYINELRQEKNKSEINYDNVEFDYNNYYLELSKELCYKIEDKLEDFIYKIEFITIIILQRKKDIIL